MAEYELGSLPRVLFAHVFRTENYRHTLTAIPDHIEISYVVQGRLYLTVDGRTESAGEGDIVCLPHRQTTYVEADGLHEHHTVCFSLGRGGRTVSLPLVTHPGSHSGLICNLIDNVIATHSVAPENELRCAGYFFQLLSELADAQADGGSDGADLYVRRAKRYIGENLNRPIRQREVAAYLGISPEYLCSIFKRRVGMPLITYLNRTKLEKIRELMERENISLARASELFGYSDPNYVSHLYRRLYHATITGRRDK